ncbi:Dam family site-specific DNA-(adenine-N6)-methyltransferase [uncultured Helicobacter sp.]|uniref:DNA adenine methylase n=1 Tax=uncultured Helicobacter sp. TaxID=175537 RepID=UPI0027DE007A|nr:Dam family site-specific DNA-(adenine-N6)-methyltransferase [uncultured Helicobacter sp.]
MTKPYTSNKNYIKSPLNYIGGKYKLLPQILPLFPKNIHTFVDLFCGGLDVAINYKAQKFYCNDNLSYLIELYIFLQGHSIDTTLQYIEQIITKYALNKENAQGYNALRADYNETKSPLNLFVLIAFGFNHQIRFNSAHKFNTPFGKNRSSFNAKMRQNLIAFTQALQHKNMQFFKLDFTEALKNIPLNTQSFVYADPPYLIAQGTYNDGKRGFSGWNEKLESKLLCALKELHDKGIKFALSNVSSHKDRENTVLTQWAEKCGFNLHFLSMDYTNANYQAKHKDKSKTCEVLITNYKAEDAFYRQ